jgi:hypothetical protein
MHDNDSKPKKKRSAKRWLAYGAGTLAVLAIVAVAALQFIQGSVERQLTDGRLVAADYWSDEPEILSAGFGFDSIIGLESLDEASVREVGGSWYGGLECTSGEEPTAANRTSAADADDIPNGYDGYAEIDDGLPIVFSWPVATDTMDTSDFRFTLNTGEVVTPHAAGMNPNWEDNERNTVVVFGDFGNRYASDDPRSVYAARVDIVEDDSPLTLVGPEGREVSAVGLHWETDRSPYDVGPQLVGAKLNRIGDEVEGEGGVTLIEHAGALPNDEHALYDEGDFRLRVLTTGGFSPDGVTAVRPDMYEDFFRVHVTTDDGSTTTLDEVGRTYHVAGGDLRVVGLSDLGQAEDPDEGIWYDDCYQEDRDNYIDIILVGDEAAARHITDVEIPSLEGGYHAFYNPGGPGPEPFEGETYTAPGPPDLEPVTIALDDPMRVDRG